MKHWVFLWRSCSPRSGTSTSPSDETTLKHRMDKGFCSTECGSWVSRFHADAVSERGERPRTRHHQIGQPARALDDHRVGVELVALSAGQYLELLVSSALREWGQAFKTDWDCGRGAQVTHCAVAFA